MRRIAVIAVLVVAVLAIALAAVPFLIPSNFLKGRVAGQVAGWTGRSVMLAGDASLSIYPHLAITVDGLTIANPPGSGDDPFVAAEGLRARLKLLPLLIGRIAFDEFELIKPRFHLVVGADGGENWKMAENILVGQPKMPLGRLTVDNGTIVYDNLVSDRREEMANVDFDVVWPTAAANAVGHGTVQWRGETIEFNGSAAAPLELLRGGTSTVRFAVASTSLRISFSGKAVTGEALTLEGDTAVVTPSLRRTIEWLGTPMGTGSILGAAAITGAMKWDGSAISFADADVELDGNGAEGAFVAHFDGVRPLIQTTLAVKKLDLSPYVEATRADLIAAGPWLLAPTRLSFAQALDADLRISAGQVLVGSTRIGKAAAAISINDGRLDITVGKTQFYGGTLEARIGAALAGETLVGSAKAEITGAQAHAALADLVGISALSGTATATFDVASRGRVWGEFANGIAGTGKVKIDVGSLNAFDMDEVAETMADPLADPIEAGAGTTVFSNLAATLAIGDGSLRTDDLTMDGKDFHLALEGRGSVLSGGVEAKARLTAGKTAIPLEVGGTWRVPTVSRDLAPVPAPVPAPTGG